VAVLPQYGRSPAGEWVGIVIYLFHKEKHSGESLVLYRAAKFAGWLLLLSAASIAARAAGTPAGTVIQSTATLSYSFGGGPTQNVTSPPASVTIAELINLTLTSQDAAAVAVSSPDSNSALTFLLTNTGNGPETFSLARNNAIAGDSYDPLNGSAGAIFLESGLQPGFQASGPNADIVYIPGGNDPTLAADASRIIYVVSNTPASLANGSAGNVALTAASTTPGAAGATPGTSLTGLGQGGVDAVVGGSRAQVSRTGGYVVGGVAVSIVKTVVGVVDPQGGSSVTAGAVITYRVMVSVTGTGTAQGLTVNDPMPANTTYVANSITVDGVARSDAADADNAEFSAGAVRASFGNTAAPASHTIQFHVTIN
jgi:uncharacterized repeat protein (TIGR01451 family)